MILTFEKVMFKTNDPDITIIKYKGKKIGKIEKIEKNRWRTELSIKKEIEENSKNKKQIYPYQYIPLKYESSTLRKAKEYLLYIHKNLFEYLDIYQFEEIDEENYCVPKIYIDKNTEKTFYFLEEEKVPDCCGSCEYVTNNNTLRCSLDGRLVTIFGLCDSFKLGVFPWGA